VGWLDFKCTWALSSKVELSEQDYQRNLNENLKRVYSSYKICKEEYGGQEIHLSTQKILSAATFSKGRLETYG
jgi:hypothetical protein